MSEPGWPPVKQIEAPQWNSKVPREILTLLAKPHWPHPAATTARAFFATGELDAAAVRLADRWYRHLATRRIAVPREQDFLTFGSSAKLKNLHKVLRLIAPQDLSPIMPALTAKRSEAWQKAKATAAGCSTSRPRPRAPELSVPFANLPKAWQRALREMRSLRQTHDAGRLSPDDRNPPSTKVIRNMEMTLRTLAGDCARQGLPVELTIETFTAWRSARLSPWIDSRGRQRAPNRHVTIAARCKELAVFAAWCEMDEALISEIHHHLRRHMRASKGAQKRKEEWMLANELGIGDVWVHAEELLEAAMAAPPASASRLRLTLDAACLAFSIVAPLRIGDLHRLRIGEHLERCADGWSLSIVTEKTGAPYERPRLWPELTPFLDAIILLSAPGGDFWSGYDARSMPSTTVFSRNLGKTDCHLGWPSKAWRRHFGIGAHIVRSLWHQMMFESEDDDQYIALALCGQGNERTAMEYIMKGNRVRARRRGRAKIRASREAVAHPSEDHTGGSRR